MPTAGGRRDAHFPAIEKKYGQPMSYWHEQMKTVKDKKYPEQIAFLRENFGFSQAHANALVMYTRGSFSSRRHNGIDDYLKTLDPIKRKTVEAIIAALTKKRPKLEVVIAWNQPMFKYEGDYVFGISVATSHILIAPFNAAVIDDFRDRLTQYKVNKKTIQVPPDWKVNASLLNDLVGAVIAAR